ncbi:MAG: type II CRISPR RNA-guided endonuclease Cas9 [Rikenellaceae bacterium]|nr:type II CRISPR RNA-guided endonuclease Cas9 [Rikenellaceae bacterium]
MKRILGLDLGSTSIGWAVVEENSEEVVVPAEPSCKDKIVAVGSRIIPLSTDESTQFSKGQALTKNADRTKCRTQRKGYDRYQLRRALLLEELGRLGMYDGATLRLSTLDLWGVRARAAETRISLRELGRVLCHLNQKRGYRTAKSDFGDKKLGDHVKQVVDRYQELHGQGMTVGQYMYKELAADPAFRCKERVYPRKAYVEEYDAIMACQRKFYPEVLTEAEIARIRDYIIFHQRPLKSCKHLVARCELERHDAEVGGRVRNCGPRVAPRSSPLFQVCKLWESINNLNITNKADETLPITQEQKQAIFEFMNTREKLRANDLKTLLGVKSREWQFGKAVGQGLQGNTTYCTLFKALGDYAGKESLLRFELHAADGDFVDTDTGEITRVIDASFEKEPLYRLWHALYSISDIEELRRVLEQKFGITDKAVVESLCRIDFVKSGYGNKSSRAIRKILPYLQEGMQYYDAKCAAGYDDTPLDKARNQARELAETMLPIPKGELRQPVVEKVLNQLVNLVNALMSEYGRFDEIRVELARELKQSREERESADKAMNRNRKENDEFAQRIHDEYGLTPTRSRIQKYKMWRESEERCMYCGNPVGVKEFLLGFGVETEHVIPRSVLFDDSFSNKVCACRKCNQEKGNRTAFDYMKQKGEGEFDAYLKRVNDLAERGKISQTKRKKLLMPASELPQDFIERQLRESQYIAKKAKEMLQAVCRNVYSTSGSITDFIRHLWGWDEVLHDLNLSRYREAGLTEWVEREVDGRKVQVERIAGWSKRMDHRHHAVDALVIACTKQGYIQRINNLNSLKEVSFRSFADKGQGASTQHRLTSLERYILQQPHFPTAEVARAVAEIAVSFKSGKRAASVGKRYIHKGGKRICVQRGVVIPRGALSEESVYGRIRSSETGKQEYVIKYKIGAIALKDVEYVVDKGIREILRGRLEQFGGKPEKAFADPVFDHQGRAIRSVRCYTGLSATVPLRYDERQEPIAFVKPANNHHVAIYEDKEGKWREHIVTFWHAVERKKYGVPIIITNPGQVWEEVDGTMPAAFLEQLPPAADWSFRFSMQQNEMFVLGMDEESYRDAMERNDHAALSRHLYRVQKLSAGIYYFRHHLETTVDDKYKGTKDAAKSIKMGKLIRPSSLGALEKLNPHKVHVGVTGKITEI